MKKKIRDIFHSDSVSLKERLLRVICTMIFFMCAIYIVISLVTSIRPYEIAVDLLCMLVVGLCFLASVRYGRGNLAVMIVTPLLTMLFFPMMFFVSGGAGGGAAAWFVVGIIYLFIMFEGVHLAVFLAVAITVDALCYLIAYRYPNLIISIDSTESRILDSAVTMTALGLTVGGLFIMQKMEYMREQKRVEEQKRKLENTNHFMNQFYSSFSNEFRNPINAIVGLNELNIRNSEDTEVIKNSQAIKHAGKMLLSLLNDIMDYSMIRNGTMKSNEVRYLTVDYIRELTDMVSKSASDKKLDFVVDIDPELPSVLYGDQKHMVQIVVNLLTNAIKYTTDGSVRLIIEKLGIEDDNVDLRITVSDTGIGIKNENQALIFGETGELDGDKGSMIEGNGLGLAVTRQLVAHMGGTITVDSVFTKGSTFTVEIRQKCMSKVGIGDRWKRPDSSIDADYVKAFEASGARILIVDDDDVNRDVLKRVLADTRLRIDEAKNGIRALQMTTQQKYQVIIMDYYMPEMNGVETMEAIRNQENGLNRDAAIIALSGTEIELSTLQKSKRNFDSILLKPVEAAVLENTILELLPEEYIEYRDSNVIELNSYEETYGSKRHKERIMITTECTCDLDAETASANNIGIIYMYINTETGRFMDTIEVDSNNLSNYLVDRGREVYSSAPSVEEFEEFFGNALEDAMDIIHISCGSKFSDSYRNARRASEGFAHVRVIDSGQASGGIGLLALTASRWAKSDKSVEDICSDIETLSRYVITNCVLPSPKYFRQKDMISAPMASLQTFLHMRPIMTLCRNKSMFHGVTMHNLNSIVVKHIAHNLGVTSSIAPGSPVMVNYVSIGAAREQLLQEALIKYGGNREIYASQSCVSVACNSGIESVSISYYRNNSLMN